MSDPGSLDKIWDDWCRARSENSALTPTEFAERLGAPASVRQAFEVAALLEGTGRLEPLLELFRSPLPEGFRFAGFPLGRCIGQGASGIVFETRSKRHGRLALKILNPLASSTREWKAALLREAQISALLDHPGIVSAVDFGVERGYAWVASPLVEGVTLSERIHSDLPFAARLRLALLVGRQLCDALHHAHERGVIHRDLKPKNVLIGPDESVHVVDFGLALQVERSSTDWSRKRVAGTLPYLAPEQARGETAAASDQYALGLVLLETLTGHSVTTMVGRAPDIRQIARRGFRPRSSFLARLPPDARSVVLRAIESEPGDRYPTLKEFEEDLARLQKGAKPVGRLPFLGRTAFRYLRRPVRTFAILVSVFLPLLIASHLWTHRPELIVIDSFQNARQVWIDGDLVGLTPVSVQLPPGTYKYEMTFLDSPNPRERVEGSFEVLRGKTTYLQDIHSYPRYLADCVADDSDLTATNSGLLWIAAAVVANGQVAMPPQWTIQVNGRRLDFDQPMAVVRLPSSKGHLVEVAADGYRTVRSTVRLQPRSLQMLAVELDPAGSPESTTLVYSPVDVGLNATTDGLRLCWEFLSEEQDPDEHVMKVFWTPVENFQTGSATLVVDLPGPVQGGIELQWKPGQSTLYEQSFSRVHAGPDREHLFLIPPWKKRGATVSPDFLKQMKGKSKVWVRLECGNAPVGMLTGYVSALRSSGLPRLQPTGTYTWKPALRIKTW